MRPPRAAARVGAGGHDPARLAFLRRQLGVAQRRGLMMVRALTSFCLAVGFFGLGTLGSLLGAAGLGVASLVAGAALLLVETRLALAMLREEAEQVRREAGLRPKARGAKPAGR